MSYLKRTVGIFVGTFCLTMLPQFVAAQSGSRSTGFQQPPSPAPQQSFRAWQGSGQDAQVLNYRPQVPATTRVGFEQYDHRAWDGLLQKYVDRNGDVDYVTWQANQQDRSTLLNYLTGMSSIDTSAGSNRQAEMAFWINAYNAMTIEGILQLYPTRSIKDHAPDANGYNIWDDFKLPVGGTEYSLNNIEHQVLRKMGDPRIHFAIVCASKGCPQLSQRAYAASSLDQQLNYSAQLFFHTPSKFDYNLQQGQFGLSPIIQWFGEDFGRNDQERLRYLSQFMPADAGQFAANGSPTINYLDYDWSLNLAPQQVAAPSQNVIAVQSLRPQQAVSGQDFPSQNVQILDAQGRSVQSQIWSAPSWQGQSFSGQTFTSQTSQSPAAQGSGIRGQVEGGRRTRPRGGCGGHGGRRPQAAAYGYGGVPVQ